MARRRKNTFRMKNIVIVSAIAIIIVAGLFYTVPEFSTALSSAGITTTPFTIPIGDDNSWSLPTVFKFEIGDFDGVHCVINMQIKQFNVDGTSEDFVEPVQLQVELLKLVGGVQSSAKEISFFKGSPAISCWDATSKKHTIVLEGGSFTTDFRVLVDGQVKTLSSTLKTIPALNRNLNIGTGGGNVQLPTLTVLASSIESSLPSVPNTVAEKLINIYFNTKGFASIIIDGQTAKLGDLSAGAGGQAKFINPNFNVGGIGTGKGTKVILQTIVPTQFYYLGGNTPVPSGVSSNQVIREGDKMTLTATGVEDNWSSSEGQPTLTIKSPTGATVTTTQMSFSKSITGGLSEFKTTVQIPIIIGQPTIDLWKGTWTADMKQAGRTQTGSITFELGDYRAPEYIPPPPVICKFPKVIIGGKCVDQPPDLPPPTPDQCPAPVDLLLAVRSLSDNELKSTWASLSLKQNSGKLDECEKLVKPLVETEMVRRGFDLGDILPPNLPPNQPPIVPTGLANAFIRYEQALTQDIGNEPCTGLSGQPLLDCKKAQDPCSAFTGEVLTECREAQTTAQTTLVGGGGGCADTSGIVPKEGIALTGFQLIGAGSCEGFRFGSVKLTPTLDFGSNVKNVEIDQSSISLQQDIFLAKNANFPEKPDVVCTGVTSSSIGSCAVKNYAFSSNPVGQVLLSQGEVTFVRNFVNKDSSGEYRITEVLLQENNLIDRIQKKGIALQDGDDISLMYLVWGKFSGTVSGTAFSHKAIPAMTYIQNFKFRANIGNASCDAPSQKVVFNGDGTVKSVGGTEGQCISCPELDAYKANSCPAEKCPEGTTGVFPECKIDQTCVLPNMIINGECTPPLDNSCPNADEIRDVLTGQCRQPSKCNVDPVCKADEKFQVTDQFDDCGGKILICVKRAPAEQPCPSPATQFRDSLGVCVTIRASDCPSGQSRNSLGICEPTGKVEVLLPPDGTTCEENQKFNKVSEQCEDDFCKLDKDFNLAQCFAQIFGSGSAPSAQISGTTQSAILVVVMLIILIIVVAVVIRIRRGKGYNI